MLKSCYFSDSLLPPGVKLKVLGSNINQDGYEYVRVVLPSGGFHDYRAYLFEIAR